MTESERIEKVPINGQRKRLVAFHEHTHTAQRPAANLRPLTAAQVMALKALSPMADEGHEASASAGTSSPRVKYNSTSSLYIDSTITKPCTEEMIFSVSVVLHDRISEGEQATAEAEAKGETLPRFKLGTKDLRPVAAEGGSVPSEDAIFLLLRSIHSIAQFSPECLVISLLFIERLRKASRVPLTMANWQPILLAALLLAQKVWDDQHLPNIDFSLICSTVLQGAYSVQDVNLLEKQFLELIEYNVSVSASLYASYYFELRTLCEKAEGERGVTFKPLSEAQQRKLELTSGSSGKELTGSNAEKQHKFKSTTALFDSES